MYRGRPEKLKASIRIFMSGKLSPPLLKLVSVQSLPAIRQAGLSAASRPLIVRS